MAATDKNTLQILRGTVKNHKSDGYRLLAGQLFYDKETKKLHIGEDAQDGIGDGGCYLNNSCGTELGLKLVTPKNPNFIGPDNPIGICEGSIRSEDAYSVLEIVDKETKEVLATHYPGNFSTAFGISTIAVGESSMAINKWSQAYGLQSFAANNSVANGTYASSFGFQTTADKEASLTCGFMTQSNNENQLVCGLANDPNKYKDALFVVGNGSYTSYKNDQGEDKIQIDSYKNAFAVTNTGVTISAGNYLPLDDAYSLELARTDTWQTYNAGNAIVFVDDGKIGDAVKNGMPITVTLIIYNTETAKYTEYQCTVQYNGYYLSGVTYLTPPLDDLFYVGIWAINDNDGSRYATKVPSVDDKIDIYTQLSVSFNRSLTEKEKALVIITRRNVIKREYTQHEGVEYGE